MPADDAPGYGTTRATTRQTPPQAPLNRGSGPSGQCESDRLKRFGRVGPIEDTATRGLIDSPTIRGHGQLFRGLRRIEVFGRGGSIGSRDQSMGLYSEGVSGSNHVQPCSARSKNSAPSPVGACSTAVRSQLVTTKTDRQRRLFPLRERRRVESIVRCELSRPFRHQSGGSLRRRWRSNR